MLRGGLLLLLLGFLAPASGRTEIFDHEQVITLDPAAALPLSMQGPASLAAAEPGVSGGVQDIFAVTPHLGLGVGLSYAAFGTAKTTVGSTVTTSSMTMFTAELLGRWALFPASEYNPYVLLGAGYNNLSLSTQTNGGPAFNAARGKPEFSLGAGVERAFASSFVAGLEARWRYIGTYDWSGKAGSFSTTNSGELLLGARFGYRFGGNWK